MKEQKFDVSFISSGDYNFFYQMYYANKSFCHIKQIIARYDNTKGISVENYRVFYEKMQEFGELKIVFNGSVSIG